MTSRSHRNTDPHDCSIFETMESGQQWIRLHFEFFAPYAIRTLRRHSAALHRFALDSTEASTHGGRSLNRSTTSPTRAISHKTSADEATPQCRSTATPCHRNTAALRRNTTALQRQAATRSRDHHETAKPQNHKTASACAIISQLGKHRSTTILSREFLANQRKTAFSKIRHADKTPEKLTDR